MKLLKNNSGQSLVELIVAIVVIEVGLFAVWSLFLVNYNSEKEAQMRIVGSNLAREGVELVKNIRDSNWLKVNANLYDEEVLWRWDQGLDAGYYNLDVINIVEERDALDEENKFVRLYLNGDDLYNVYGDQPTQYERAIGLKDICCVSADGINCDDSNYVIVVDLCDDTSNEIKIGINVVSEVRWRISTHLRSFKTELNLYNWQ